MSSLYYLKHTMQEYFILITDKVDRNTDCNNY